MSESCEDCKFWQRIGGATGQCRVESPKIIEDSDYITSNGYVGVFPLTSNYIWCGKFHAKE